jgi:predicted transposase/invertase (TIGR01784 family)
MSPAERAAYYHHLDNAVILKDNIDTARGEGMIEGLERGLEKGRAEGLEKGRAEGQAEGKKSVARNLKALGLDVHSISSATGLSEGEINNL